MGASSPPASQLTVNGTISGVTFSANASTVAIRTNSITCNTAVAGCTTAANCSISGGSTYCTCGYNAGIICSGMNSGNYILFAYFCLQLFLLKLHTSRRILHRFPVLLLLPQLHLLLPQLQLPLLQLLPQHPLRQRAHQLQLWQHQRLLLLH